MLPHTKFRWNRTIGRFSRWRPPSSWILKNSVFGHVNRIKFNICCSVPNFIKIGRFFTDIWRFNDFQNGGRPPSCILNICRFCHLALVDMPFCFLIQNVAEIGQSVDELWPKKWFSSFWSREQNQSTGVDQVWNLGEGQTRPISEFREFYF